MATPGAATWRRRLQAGEILLNGEPLVVNATLRGGDRLIWRRMEPAVPACWAHDDGDLLVIDKPSGLPLAAARCCGCRAPAAGSGGLVPHRGRAVGAVSPPGAGRARSPPGWGPGARLRQGVAAAPEHSGEHRMPQDLPGAARSGALELGLGDPLPIGCPIGRRSIPCCQAVVSLRGSDGLAARSTLTLLERRGAGDLAEVAIATGCPTRSGSIAPPWGAAAGRSPLRPRRTGPAGRSARGWRLPAGAPTA